MLKPGEKSGPMMLPASYTRAQLAEYKWCSKKQKFLGKVDGPWGSKLNDGRWQGQSNRSRAYKESHL